MSRTVKIDIDVLTTLLDIADGNLDPKQLDYAEREWVDAARKAAADEPWGWGVMYHPKLVKQDFGQDSHAAYEAAIEYNREAVELRIAQECWAEVVRVDRSVAVSS